MEVNEASCVIQEAAHEDANIIFGAVVDPNLKGKVKITVISTGFDRKATMRPAPAAALQTPVDLSAYTDHFTRTPEAPVEEPPAKEPSYAPPPPSMTVTRRPALELSLPLPVRGGNGVTQSAEEGGIEVASPLDVPAFLRRQN
jgi:cell division protein FtsZ